MSSRTGGDSPVSDARSRASLDRFHIERTLGRGGMGEVLLAYDTLLDRRVALKRLLPTGESLASGRAAVLREARRASRINDPHVAALHDVIDLGDEIVLVMEYVEGVTLRRRMTGPLPRDEFLRLARPCVAGVAAAHAHGVIHRDLKPENLLVTPRGEVKILDFGIARRAPSAAPGVTSTTDPPGTIAGTPHYMAPEALLGQPVDERADLYSLGVVFYEMLTARRPFDSPTFAGLVDQVLNTDPEPVSALHPEVGHAVSAVVSRLMAKTPQERFATASDVLAALAAPDDVQTPVPPAGRRSRVEPPPASPRRRARFAAVLAGAIVVLAAVGAIAWRAAAALPDVRRVAVLDPRAANEAPLAVGTVRLLARRLHAHVETTGFQAAPFEDVLDEAVRTPEAAHSVLGANLALRVVVTMDREAWRGRLELFDAPSGRRRATRRIETAADRPFEFHDRLYREAAALVGLAPHAGGAVRELGVRGAGAARFLLEGLGRIAASDDTAALRRTLSDYETACRIEPSSAAAWAARAVAELDLSRALDDAAWLDRAEQSARGALALDSTRAEPHRALARVAMARGRHDASIPSFAAAMRIDPSDDYATYRHARAFERLGRPDLERDAYDAAAARHPHRWQPRWWRATWSYRHGDVDGAVDHYRAMVARAPELWSGYASLGGLLVLRGDYAAAIDTLRLAVALRPSVEAYGNLGTAYFNSGRGDDAVAAYNQSFQFGVHFETWANLGDAHFWLAQRRDEAVDAWRQAIRLAREQCDERTRAGKEPFTATHAHLASLYARTGSPDSARVYLASAVARDSANPTVAHAAALTLWELGERPEALRWLARSVRAGYPVVWIRDSPVFVPWRNEPEFRSLVAAEGPRALRAAVQH